MDDDISSTSAMSSGVVAVLDRLDVEDKAVSAVKKSAFSAFLMVMPSFSISSVETVLSVHMRPTFDVLSLMRFPQSQIVDGSLIVTRCAA